MYIRSADFVGLLGGLKLQPGRSFTPTPTRAPAGPAAPVSDQFVTASGVKFRLDGHTHHFIGANFWQGTYLAAISATCTDGQPFTVALRDFKADMTFKIERK